MRHSRGVLQFLVGGWNGVNSLHPTPDLPGCREPIPHGRQRRQRLDICASTGRAGVADAMENADMKP